MRIVVALGGNALLRRSDPMTTEVQRRNIRIAAQAIAPLAAEHSLIVVHGNGPQVGLLSLQAESYRGAEPYPLDVLDAGTQGMIGYLVQQELRRVLPPDRPVVTVLTMITVDPDDPAFANPTKFVGPVYSQQDAEALRREKGWAFRQDGAAWRRVVPSPEPQQIIEIEPITWLLERGSGGRLRRRRRHPHDALLHGRRRAVRRRSRHRQGPGQRAVGRGRRRGPVRHGHRRGRRLPRLGHTHAAEAGRGDPRGPDRSEFAAGSMGPKVDAAVRFVTKTGRRAAIGALADIPGIVAGTAGTNIVPRTRAGRPELPVKPRWSRCGIGVPNLQPGYPVAGTAACAHAHPTRACRRRRRWDCVSPPCGVREVIDMTSARPTDQYLSVRQAAFIGVGAMVGAGIFALLGAAGAVAGAAVWLSFLIAGAVAGLQGYSFAKFGARYPSAAGLFEYLRRGFGEGHLTGVTAWLTYVTNAIITAMVAVSFGSYASALFTHGNPTWAKIFAALILVVMTGVNIVGSQLVAKAQTVIVYVVLGILVLFAIVTLATLKPALLAPSGYPPLRDIIASVALTFFAFLGFGIITFTAKDLREPSRQLPRAMTLALVHRHRHLRRHRTRRVRHPARPGGGRLGRDRARGGRPAHPR